MNRGGAAVEKEQNRSGLADCYGTTPGHMPPNRSTERHPLLKRVNRAFLSPCQGGNARSQMQSGASRDD